MVSAEGLVDVAVRVEDVFEEPVDARGGRRRRAAGRPSPPCRRAGGTRRSSSRRPSRPRRRRPSSRANPTRRGGDQGLGSALSAGGRPFRSASSRSERSGTPALPSGPATRSPGAAGPTPCPRPPRRAAPRPPAGSCGQAGRDRRLQAGRGPSAGPQAGRPAPRACRSPTSRAAACSRSATGSAASARTRPRRGDRPARVDRRQGRERLDRGAARGASRPSTSAARRVPSAVELERAGQLDPGRTSSASFASRAASRSDLSGQRPGVVAERRPALLHPLLDRLEQVDLPSGRLAPSDVAGEGHRAPASVLAGSP